MIKSVLKLLAITGLSIFILMSYHAVAEFFGVSEEEQTLGILGEIIPQSVEITPVVGEDGQPVYYEAFDTQGMLVGYGFVAEFRGMWGEIRVGGGLDLDYHLTGIKVIKHSETPGLGSRIKSEWFLEQFVGLEAHEVKIVKLGGKIDAITGATVSSRAVTTGIRTEMERVISELGAGM